MKYFSKVIVSLGILFFIYKIMTIHVVLSITVGWMVALVGLGAIWEMFGEES